jgi:predicted outer membrane protein
MGTGMNHDMSGMQGMSSTPGQGMAAMQQLQNATGTEFNTMFVSQMLQMHEQKLAELESASTTLTDPELKTLVTKAIPKIRMHRDMLARINKGNNNTGSNSNSQ